MLGRDRDRDQAACWSRDQTETEHLVYQDETEQQVPKSRFAQFSLKCSGNLDILAAATHVLGLYVCYNFSSTLGSPPQLSLVSRASDGSYRSVTSDYKYYGMFICSQTICVMRFGFCQ